MVADQHGVLVVMAVMEQQDLQLVVQVELTQAQAAAVVGDVEQLQLQVHQVEPVVLATLPFTLAVTKH